MNKFENNLSPDPKSSFQKEQEGHLKKIKEISEKRKNLVPKFFERFSVNPETYARNSVPLIKHSEKEYDSNFGKERYKDIKINNLSEFIEKYNNPEEKTKRALLKNIFFKFGCTYIQYLVQKYDSGINIEDKLKEYNINYIIKEQNSKKLLYINETKSEDLNFKVNTEEKEKFSSLLFNEYGERFLNDYWKTNDLSASLIPFDINEYKIFETKEIPSNLLELKEDFLENQKAIKSLFQNIYIKNEDHIRLYRYLTFSEETLERYDGVGISFTSDPSYICNFYNESDYDNIVPITLVCDVPLSSINWKETYWKSLWHACHEREVVLFENSPLNGVSYLLWNQMYGPQVSEKTFLKSLQKKGNFNIEEVSKKPLALNPDFLNQKFESHLRIKELSAKKRNQDLPPRIISDDVFDVIEKQYGFNPYDYITLEKPIILYA